MPEISSFYGIRILMNYNDFGHHNHPHIHAHYQDFRAVFAIPEGNMLAGNFPRRQTRFIEEWIDEHKQDLLDNWALAIIPDELFKITPYER